MKRLFNRLKTCTSNKTFPWYKKMLSQFLKMFQDSDWIADSKTIATLFCLINKDKVHKFHLLIILITKFWVLNFFSFFQQSSTKDSRSDIVSDNSPKILRSKLVVLLPFSVGQRVVLLPLDGLRQHRPFPQHWVIREHHGCDLLSG